MVRFFLFSCLLALTFPLQAENPMRIGFSDEGFDQLLKQAEDENKPFFVSFYTSWSSMCRSLEKFTFTDSALVPYVAENYLAYKVQADAKTPEVKLLLDTYGIMFYPTIIIFNPQGQVLHRFSGYINGEKLLEELQRYRFSEESEETASHPAAPIVDDGASTSFLTLDLIEPELEEVTVEEVPAAEVPIYHRPRQVAPRIQEETLLRPVEEEIQPQPAKETAPVRLQGFGIQIGAYSTKSAAIVAQRELEAAYPGTGAYLIYHTSDQGKSFYKVGIGPFMSATQAKAMQSRYKQDSGKQCFMVPMNRYY
ncbi:MAG: thioredoxin fold domain-containing protein [Bacteroidota bacterium]